MIVPSVAEVEHCLRIGVLRDYRTTDQTPNTGRLVITGSYRLWGLSSISAKRETAQIVKIRSLNYSLSVKRMCRHDLYNEEVGLEAAIL